MVGKEDDPASNFGFKGNFSGVNSLLNFGGVSTVGGCSEASTEVCEETNSTYLPRKQTVCLLRKMVVWKTILSHFAPSIFYLPYIYIYLIHYSIYHPYFLANSCIGTYSISKGASCFFFFFFRGDGFDSYRPAAAWGPTAVVGELDAIFRLAMVRERVGWIEWMDFWHRGFLKNASNFGGYQCWYPKNHGISSH